MNKDIKTTEPQMQTVIDALYDLPLGGNWRDLQAALCDFWQHSEEQPSPQEIRSLERHFDRAMIFLERMPADKNRWRNELFRIPVPACVFDKQGSIVDINNPGLRHLGYSERQLIRLPKASTDIVRARVKALKRGKIVTLRIDAGKDDQLNLFISCMPEQLHDEGSLYLGVMVTRDLPAHGLLVLAEQYGLTNAEAQLCLKLSSGNSLDNVAQISNIKKTTLRTHLANCFAKLGVKSQPELVALVLHSLFASAQFQPQTDEVRPLTPHLDPEVHGHPRFIRHELVDGRVIGCLEYGDPDGIPAIYLHGSFGSGLFMKGQKLHGNGVRMLAVERYGVGETSVSSDSSPQAYASDVLSLIDSLGIKEFAVIGRSMGSWDAVSLVLAATERVRLFVLAGGRLPVQHATEHKEEAPFYASLYNSIWNSDMIGRLMLRMMLLQLMARGPEYLIGRNEPVGLEHTLDDDKLYARHMRATWLRSAEGGADPIHNHLKLYKKPIPKPPWLNLQTPTILIHGLEDKIVSYDRLIDQTSSFANRTVKLLPNVGHRLVQLAMGEVLRTVRDEWSKLQEHQEQSE